MTNHLQKNLSESKQASNALITGGVQGIGRAIVDAFVARGDTVFVFDCLPVDDDRVRAMCENGVRYECVDVCDIDSIKVGFANVFEALGDVSLDILVNNAGITRDMLALRLSEADWDAVLDVNLKGAFFCAQQALQKMIRKPRDKKSYIVNMASVVGIIGNPGQINYAASKAGLIAVTKTLAKEYASRNILVNAVAPGFIETRMTDKLSDKVKEMALEHIPLKRFGTSLDVANCIAFLTSGKADYLTGQVIHVDGGMVL